MELPPPALPCPALPCPVATETRPWTAPLQPQPAAAATAADSGGADYRHQLKPTPAGWPRRTQWCVWVEPVVSSGPTAIWEQRWHQAVLSALGSWQELLPISLVNDPAQAQVLVQRRRPPLLNNRASHGRSLLQLVEVRRAGLWQLEPRVEVLIGPGQAPAPLQATALHELGHAFGLWGHSDQPGDAMAVKPGAKPVLSLSERDQASLRWLQQQPGLGMNDRPQQ